MSGHGETLLTVTPDQQRITCKNKRRKTSDTSIIRKILFKNQSTQGEWQKKYFNWCRKTFPKETPPLFWHKVDYKGHTNYKTHGYDNSPSETDVCVRNLSKEY